MLSSYRRRSILEKLAGTHGGAEAVFRRLVGAKALAANREKATVRQKALAGAGLAAGSLGLGAFMLRNRKESTN